MFGRPTDRGTMHVARAALFRCETLDLSGAPAAVAPGLHDVSDNTESPEPGPPQRTEPDQLDLFRHSPSELAANDVRRALLDRDAAGARRGLAALTVAPGYTTFVADCAMVIELIERQDARWADPAAAVPWIEMELWPAAERCLQRDALLLIRPALLALLDRCERRFDPGCRHAHASYLWQRLGQPTQAVLALEQDPHWREPLEGLLWHADLSEQAQMHERVNADVFDLCLRWPEAAENWLNTSRAWSSRWFAWCELDDALPMHAFPAWCRLTRAVEFAIPDASDQRLGAQLLRTADQLARRSSDLALRKALHAQSPALLAAWLAERS